MKSTGSGAPVWQNESVDIGPAEVVLGASLTYNGQSQTKTIVSVVLYGVPLEEGDDYIVSGNTGTTAGTYSLLITGVNGYKGAIAKQWEIERAEGSVSASKSTMDIFGLSSPSDTATISHTGDGEITVSVVDDEIATTQISGSTLTVTGMKSGNTTVIITKAQGQNYTEASYSIPVEISIPVDELDDNSWSVIRHAADEDLGQSIWSIGDMKAVAIDGTIGGNQMTATWYAYIIGFNHNSAVEGNHRIHFQCFYSAPNGKRVALVGADFSQDRTNGDIRFNMNHWGNYNGGGWKGSDIRYDCLGSTDVEPDDYGSDKRTYLATVGKDATENCATSPNQSLSTVMKALPSELRAEMKPVTKYTNNTGGSSGIQVTASIDYLWLLSECEVFGSTTQCYSGEANYQEEYEYYLNGNMVQCFRTDSMSNPTWWLLRSPQENTSGFAYVAQNGAISATRSSFVCGCSPCFAV